MKSYKDLTTEVSEARADKIKQALKKSGFTLKASMLSLVAGLGAKELDYLVKALNAIRPMLEEEEKEEPNDSLRS